MISVSYTHLSMLSEFPGAKHVASAHLTRLTNLLSEASKGRYSKDTAITFREAARASIGSNMPAKSLELKHTIKLIQELDSEIDEIENEIKVIMDEINSPILSIPGINYRMGAMIIAEIGDFSRFDSPDKILAYAGFSPSTYQSGQLDGAYAHMEDVYKRQIVILLLQEFLKISKFFPVIIQSVNLFFLLINAFS